MYQHYVFRVLQGQVNCLIFQVEGGGAFCYLFRKEANGVFQTEAHQCDIENQNILVLKNGHTFQTALQNQVLFVRVFPWEKILFQVPDNPGKKGLCEYELYVGRRGPSPQCGSFL